MGGAGFDALLHPFHRHPALEQPGQFPITVQRPVLPRASRKGMDGGISAVSRGAVEPRNRLPGAAHDFRRLAHVVVGGVQARSFRRHRGEEVKRETGHRLPELGAVRPVPGNDRIEAPQILPKPGRRVHAGEPRQVQAGRDDGARPVGEPRQGQVLRGCPDLRIVRLKRFQGRQREDEVANRSGSYKQSFQAIATEYQWTTLPPRCGEEGTKNRCTPDSAACR